MLKLIRVLTFYRTQNFKKGRESLIVDILASLVGEMQ